MVMLNPIPGNRKKIRIIFCLNHFFKLFTSYIELFGKIRFFGRVTSLPKTLKFIFSAKDSLADKNK